MTRTTKPATLDARSFHQAIEQAYNAVMITTAELVAPGPEIVYVNRALCAQTGYAADELLGQTPRILQGPGTERAVLDRLRDTIAKGGFFEGQAINYRKDGTPYLVRWNISPLRDPDGRITHYVSVQSDITEQVRTERFNQQLLSSLGEGVFGIDRAGRLTFVNQAALELLGYPGAEALLGRNAHDMLHSHHPSGCPFPEADCPLYQVLESGEPLKGWRDTFFGADGRPVPVEAFASALRSLTGEIDGLVVSFRDISKQQQLEAQLEYAAQHDSLTGAFNRHFFDALFEREHAHAARRGEPLSLMLLDVDHFKTVNDRYGHLVGDDVLKALVRHLSERLRGSDVLARWGGEEFALLLPETTLEGAVALAESLRASVEHAELAAGLPRLTISIGVTRIRSGADLASSFHRADDALYRAKSSGRNRVCAA